MDLLTRGIHLQENKHREKNILKSHNHQVNQILYVLEGKGRIHFDENNYPFKPDSIVFIPPHSSHSILSYGNMTVLVLEFELEKLNSDMIQLLNHHQFSVTKIIDLNLFDARNIKQLLRRMLYEQSQPNILNLVAMKIYLSELLLILCKTSKEPSITGANVLRAERLQKYIDTHYFEIVDANAIAHKLGISTRHVNTIFKERYDLTPMKYLNGVRMEVTKKMLLESDKDISSICFEVGFEALSTFYRRFKDYTGLSPQKYRIKNSQGRTY